MLFNSFDFLLFFVAVLVVQRVLPHRPRNLFLLAASYFFYGCWDWRFLFLIAISTSTDYLCGHAIHASNDVRRRKLLVACSAVVNLGILGFFKYAGFFVASAQAALASVGWHVDPWTLRVVLPVGISFYTFQCMSYTIDIYRRETEPVRNFFDFALFVSFFPQLVAGPIERAKNLAPQMTRKTLPTGEQLRVGGWLIFWGLFKKVVIADNMAPIVSAAFGDPAALGSAGAMIAVYAFALQIYADFSGYSDIARGAAKLMGYELMLNFRLPYFAVNPRDFWQRWHVSLSTWLRDYLYIPLGGNRKGSGRTYVNLMLTMLLGGLWHGAAWTFVIWGAFHGALLCVHRFVVGIPGKRGRRTLCGDSAERASRRANVGGALRAANPVSTRKDCTCRTGGRAKASPQGLRLPHWGKGESVAAGTAPPTLGGQVAERGRDAKPGTADQEPGTLLPAFILHPSSFIFHLSSSRFWWFLRVFVMFHLVCLGWLIFRAQSWANLTEMLGAIGSGGGFDRQALGWLWQVAMLCWPLALVQVLQGVTADTNAVLKLSFVARAALYTILLVMLLALGSFGAKEFIYFQF